MNKSGLDPLQKGRAERLDAAIVGFNTKKIEVNMRKKLTCVKHVV